MNKAQAAALLLMGAGVGVGGREVAGALSTKAEAAPIVRFVHAVDLRQFNPASPLSVLVYATEQQADGGTKDVGQASACEPSAQTRNALQLNMAALGKECRWTGRVP